MTTKIIIPILNSSFKAFQVTQWYLSKNVSIGPIFPEDLGLILGKAPEEYQSLSFQRSKCIRFENVDPTDSDDECRDQATMLAFLLNYFKKTNPIAVFFAVHITTIRKPRFDKIIDLPVVPDIILQRKNKYQIREGVKRKTVSDFFSVIAEAYKKNSNILLTLGRFNSALSRLELIDKIIDITISLESLIDSTQELTYKFSLFNALAAEKDKNKVNDTFKLLKLLYETRSLIVHGGKFSQNGKNKIKKIVEKWDDILRIAKNAIAYHLIYIFKNEVASWHKHQENLALGVEKRIIE
ncbi:hypothetical protein ACFLRW_02180 [Acidobacteriota bacterium]